MEGHHHCAMTLRHPLSIRAVGAQCQGIRRHALHKRASESQGISSSAVTGQQHHRRGVFPSLCKAVKSPEVSAEKKKGSTSSTDGMEGSQRFGLATADLNQLADSAHKDVYKTSSIVSSAAQLAHLLDSSLTGGISESSAQMADRGSRLGRNKLPERNQVCLTWYQQMHIACLMNSHRISHALRLLCCFAYLYPPICAAKCFSQCMYSSADILLGASGQYL